MESALTISIPATENGLCIPPHVMDIMFNNLEREDLLNCRSVCNAWNLAASVRLKKSKHMQALDCNKLKEYVKFVVSKSAYVPLPLKITVSSQVNWKSVAKDLGVLQRLAGRNCIACFEVAQSVNGLKEVSLSVLQSLCSELLSMDLPPNIFKLDFFEDDLLELGRNNLIRFPRLKDCTCSNYDSFGVKFNKLILDKCPALEVLDCLGNLELEDTETRIPFGFLKSLRIDTYRAESGLLLAQINSSSTEPILKMLDFHSDEDVPQDEMLAILEKLSTSLESFQYTLNEDVSPSTVIKFPVLVCLRNLTIRERQDCSIERLLYLDLERMNLTPPFLPSLKSITFPFGMHWESSHEFLCVEDITLMMNATDRDNSIRSNACENSNVKKLVDLMYLTFPNVRKIELYFTTETNTRRLILSSKCVISTLFRAPKGKWIEQFSTKNYRLDYLGDVLTGLDAQGQQVNVDALVAVNSPEMVKQTIKKCWTSLCMDTTDLRLAYIEGSMYANFAPAQALTGLEVLRLAYTKDLPRDAKEPHYWEASVNSYDGASKNGYLKLDLIHKHMPNLRVVEISAVILSSNGRSSAWNVAREIEKKYPTWTVNII